MADPTPEGGNAERLRQFHTAIQECLVPFFDGMKNRGYECAEYFDTEMRDHSVAKRSKSTGLTAVITVNFPRCVK